MKVLIFIFATMYFLGNHGWNVAQDEQIKVLEAKIEQLEKLNQK